MKLPLDLSGLRGQVLGLLPGEVTLYDPQSNGLASETMVVDARGSLRSLYGFVGIAVAGATVFAFLAAVIAMGRHRLSRHRLNRGLRFFVPGLGLGLSLTFTLSMLRVFVPRPALCARIVVASAGALFALGFLTPRPPLYADDVAEEPAKEAMPV